ncbi:cytidine deaminase [Nicoletella semolina]|uniref:Cytidine deaminase n=1 Tax=Nicoletella semolina TaxID=271160 RepID=A0A4R2NCI4_9PAST|nr:cytidine deaminase [Nicoletella semolina]MDH2924249.1 cytidine deaminase [Nicoletella semolina]TCP18853.1 cytidine deaminase [Nicoletella semolina]
MPTLSDIKTRLDNLTELGNPAVQTVIEQLVAQRYHAHFSAEIIKKLTAQFQLSVVELALACLPVAASYALTPVSNFNVGAIAIGQSGDFYFGANQEYAGNAIQQSIHAEQSAISHAWLAGEKAITDVIVNYTPCGHCRQFMNELNSAATLKIHLPHSQNNLLHNYLPDAFGPKDLQISHVLFDEPAQDDLACTHSTGDKLIQAAITACLKSYAPYSQARSGVALQVVEQVVTGRYAENAAFNPSFLPLQSALNYRRLCGLADIEISRVVMVEMQGSLSHRHIVESLVKTHLELPIEYLNID